MIDDERDIDSMAEQLATIEDSEIRRQEIDRELRALWRAKEQKIDELEEEKDELERQVEQLQDEPRVEDLEDRVVAILVDLDRGYVDSAALELDRLRYDLRKTTNERNTLLNVIVSAA